MMAHTHTVCSFKIMDETKLTDIDAVVSISVIVIIMVIIIGNMLCLY